jgi:hypothetical protein
MVWKGIQVHDVMQQDSYCAQGRGKFGCGNISLLGHYQGNQPTKTQTIASQPSQLILIHPMDDFGWSGRGSKCMM